MSTASTISRYACFAGLVSCVVGVPVLVSAQSLPQIPRMEQPRQASPGDLPAMPKRDSERAALATEPTSPTQPELTADRAASQPPSDEVILVQAEIECASEDSRLQLLEELRLRLPEDIEVVTASGEEVSRRLDWSWQAEDGCRLVLRDAQGLIELPLPPEPEAEQLRQAVVRVAWFISMNRDAGAEPAPVAVATEPEPREINGLPNIPAVELEQKGLLAPPTGESATTTSAAPIMSDEERTRFEAFKNSMAGIRNGSPNLFKKFRDFEEKPMTASFLGEPAVVGAAASIGTDLTGIERGTAWLMNARAGVTLDERVGLGFVYKRLTSSVLHDPNWGNLENPPPDAFSGLGSIRMNLVGMDAEAVILRRDAWTWRASGGLHMGRIKSVSIEGDGQVNSFLMLGEVDTQLHLALLPWLEAGVGLGLRAPLLQGNDWVVSPEELRSGFFVMNLRVKLF